MIGPGKYDQLCSTVRVLAKAKAAIVIVIDGNRGSGFSCQGDLATTVALPELLETLAKQIREDMQGGREPGLEGGDSSEEARKP